MGDANALGEEWAESDIQALRERVLSLEKERTQWLDERVRLQEEVENLRHDVETLQNRCQKMARASTQSDEVLKVDAEVQTEVVEAAGASRAAAPEGASVVEARPEVGDTRLPPAVAHMLRCPKDEAAQLEGIEALFQEQTQVDGDRGVASAAALHGSLEASVAIFGNHPNNHALLLKASQFLSVLLAEPNVQQQLPLAVLFQAAQAVMTVSTELLANLAGGTALGASAGQVGAPPSPSKLLTWFLSLLALLLPGVAPRLKDEAQSAAFVQDLLANLVSRLLSSPEVPQEALALKCVQLLPLLPMEAWVQRACLESGAVHSLAFAHRRCVAAMPSRSKAEANEAALPTAIRGAVTAIFTDNAELCVKALQDTFVNDDFICLEVLEELRGAEQRRRGTLRALDCEHGILGKVLSLWHIHQRVALEDAEPQKSASREVLQKAVELLNAVVLKIQPQVLLQRMQEFRDFQVLQRVALAAVHLSAQLRLQLAVNYVDNGVIPVIIACMQMFLQHYEGAQKASVSPAENVEAAVGLLRDGLLPTEGWTYLLYCLEVCLHILSHWSATKISMRHKADVMDARAAPLLLAQGGLVDVLVELIDPTASGFELHTKPPAALVQKASETLQALFEQSGHICLFCMQHYAEVKQMVSMGCESLTIDPLAEFPEMQQQAVEQLTSSLERFSASDDRLGRKILKALTVIFESSYQLVAWFLRTHAVSSLGDYGSLDVHIEAVRAVARTPYWSAEDAPLLPEFVALIAQLIMRSIQGHEGPGVAKPAGRVMDLTEAEEVVHASIAAVLHLVLIDPSPPTVLQNLAKSLSLYGKVESEAVPREEEAGGGGGGAAAAAGGDGESEKSVNAVMKVMQVFPSSDRVQMNCQHLLTSLLGE